MDNPSGQVQEASTLSRSTAVNEGRPEPSNESYTARRHSFHSTSPLSTDEAILPSDSSPPATTAEGSAIGTDAFVGSRAVDGAGNSPSPVEHSQAAQGASFVPFDEYGAPNAVFLGTYGGFPPLPSSSIGYPDSGWVPGANEGVNELGLDMASLSIASREYRDPVKPTAGERRRGKCKFFNSQKGFGFLLDNFPADLSNEEVFVHYTAIDAVQEGPRGFKSLCEGEDVEYTITVGAKGWQAQKVTGPKGAPCIGSTISTQPSATHAPVQGIPPNVRGRGGAKGRGSRSGGRGGDGTQGLYRDFDQQQAQAQAYWASPQSGMVGGLSPLALSSNSLYTSPLQHTSPLPAHPSNIIPFYPSSAQQPGVQGHYQYAPHPNPYLSPSSSASVSNQNPTSPYGSAVSPGFYPSPPSTHQLQSWGMDPYAQQQANGNGLAPVYEPLYMMSPAGYFPAQVGWDSAAVVDERYGVRNSLAEQGQSPERMYP